MSTPIEKAVAILGGQGALARAAGVSQPAAHKWLHGKSRPGPLSVMAIERATNGAVTRFELRPDIYPPEDMKAQEGHE